MDGVANDSGNVTRLRSCLVDKYHFLLLRIYRLS